MKILALGGAGHIGSGGVRELVKKAPEMEVIIADYHLDNARKLAAEVGGTPRRSRWTQKISINWFR